MILCLEIDSSIVYSIFFHSPSNIEHVEHYFLSRYYIKKENYLLLSEVKVSVYENLDLKMF